MAWDLTEPNQKFPRWLWRNVQIRSVKQLSLYSALILSQTHLGLSNRVLETKGIWFLIASLPLWDILSGMEMFFQLPRSSCEWVCKSNGIDIVSVWLFCMEYCSDTMQSWPVTHNMELPQWAAKINILNRIYSYKRKHMAHTLKIYHS